MNWHKTTGVAATAIGVLAGSYLAYSHLGYFSNVSFLGGVLLLQVVVVCLWNYAARFFPFVMIVFMWAGMNVPLQSTWTAGRWMVLAAGTGVGVVLWLRTPSPHFGTLHLVALSCVSAAFVSASLSPYPKMAFLKALSLLLLFTYCSAGARLAVFGRGIRFFQGLLLGCEIVVYGTAACYFVLGKQVWGNPNSLGAAMSIGVFPILLWGWRVSELAVLRRRRLIALLGCVYLIFFSGARAGMAAMVIVSLLFCFCLRQYRLMAQVTMLFLALIAVKGVLGPESLDKQAADAKDSILYKGHKAEGVLGSRKAPWEATMAGFRDHPYFGTGYGTSPTGEDPGAIAQFSSSAETSREHGSSYMTIAEWVGLIGVLPFALLLGTTAFNVGRVGVWLRRTPDPHHFAVPLAAVLVAGFVHAGFEDWLFAVGAYPCVFFWVFAFILNDLVPANAAVPVRQVVPGVPHRVTDWRTLAPNR